MCIGVEIPRLLFFSFSIIIRVWTQPPQGGNLCNVIQWSIAPIQQHTIKPYQHFEIIAHK